MTLQDKLSGVIPWRMKRKDATQRLRYPKHYKILSEHYEEIEAARKGGYSYGQIQEGLKEAYGLGISFSLLVHYYTKIKREREMMEAQ